MNFKIKVTSGNETKEYTIPDGIEVQCGSGDEFEENREGVRCSTDISDSSLFPTVLSQIKTECVGSSSFNVQCLFNDVAIYSQDNMTEIKYRIVKSRDSSTIREELFFYE